MQSAVERITSPRRASIVCALVGLAACAGGSPPARDARGTYPGRCDLVAVEYQETAPAEDAPRPDVAERDAMLLVARYRAQGGSGSPIQLGILVRRADAEALRARLAGQATVACRPDTGEVEPPPLPPNAQTVPPSEIELPSPLTPAVQTTDAQAGPALEPSAAPASADAEQAPQGR